MHVLERHGLGEVEVDSHTRRVTVATNGGAAALVPVLRELDEAAVAIDDIALRRPTLDDVFLALTGHAAAESVADATEEKAA